MIWNIFQIKYNRIYQTEDKMHCKCNYLLIHLTDNMFKSTDTLIFIYD